jgi:hypothetical protein
MFVGLALSLGAGNAEGRRETDMKTGPSDALRLMPGYIARAPQCGVFVAEAGRLKIESVYPNPGTRTGV